MLVAGRYLNPLLHWSLRTVRLLAWTAWPFLGLAVAGLWIRSFFIGDTFLESSSRLYLANGASFAITPAQLAAMDAPGRSDPAWIVVKFTSLESSNGGIGLWTVNDRYCATKDEGVGWYEMRSVSEYPEPDASRRLWSTVKPFGYPRIDPDQHPRVPRSFTVSTTLCIRGYKRTIGFRSFFHTGRSLPPWRFHQGCASRALSCAAHARAHRGRLCELRVRLESKRWAVS